VRIIVLGAGQVGTTIVEALHDEHELTVIDTHAERLSNLAHRFDIRVVEGNGTSRRVLQEAGVGRAGLMIACTSRDEANIVASLFVKKIAPETITIVRTTDVEYLEIWRERQLEVDFIVSSELEAAHAVSHAIGVPAARQTDVFANGQVQIVEFDVEERADAEVVGPSLRTARIPGDSKVASIIRAGELRLPRGDERILPGDRIVVIGSPRAAREWSEIMAGRSQRVKDVAIFGAGRIGMAVARLLLEEDLGVRIIESNRERALEVAEALPDARVFNATGIDPEFLDRERIGAAKAAVFAMRDDAKNYYAATLAKLHGVDLTIAIVHDTVSMEVFERAGVDIAINPRALTAEEIVRFAHDPRTQQVAMLEGDRFEILDITVRESSKLVNLPFRELPMTGSLIGAIVRDGTAVFPRGDDVLLPGDRAILFTESSRVPEVERAL
jgi:trk system potassium uptake protein TrkA